MGVYAITGASSGIGAKTKELLEQKRNMKKYGIDIIIYIFQYMRQEIH